MKRFLLLLPLLVMSFSGTAIAGGIIGLEKVENAPDVTANVGKLYVKEVIISSGVGDTKLLIHSNATQGNTSFTDSAGGHPIIGFNGIIHTEQAQKFGATSINFDGFDDYLKTPMSPDWDVLGSIAGDWTMDLWVKNNEVVNSVVLIGQFQDKRNMWILLRHPEVGLQFFVRDTEDTIVRASQLDASTFMGTEKWYHIAVCKVGASIGVYLDGKQVAYGQFGKAYVVKGDLYMGRRGDGVNIFSGHMDEIRIVKNNRFNASPNQGKTDTIAVPGAADDLAPITLPKLFYMDDEGNEYSVDLTPAK